MSFFFLAVAILGIAILGIYNKHILNSTSAHSFALLTNIIPAVIFIPIALSNWKFTNSKGALIAIIASSALWAFSSFLYQISTKRTDVSVKAPLSQSKLLWALFFGFLVLQEQVSWLHFVGVLIIFFGVSAMVWHPEKRLGSLKDIGVRWTLGSAIISGAVAIADKYALGFFSVELYGFLTYLFPGLIILLFTPRRGQDVAHLWKTKKVHVLISSVISLVTYYAMLKTYSLMPISIAYPLLQLSTIILVLGGIVFFGEKENLFQKFSAAVLVVVGSILLKI